MRAAVFNGSELELRDRDPPEVGPRELRIRVEAAAICGTDLRILRQGHRKLPPDREPVLGHEFTGRIDRIGDQVQGWEQGQRIVVVPNIGCRRCPQCETGHFHRCPNQSEALGVSMDGGFAEYVRIPAPALDHNVLPVPDSIPAEQAAITEPTSTCYNALEACWITPGDRVLIVGAGPMGMLNLLMAQACGASKVMVSARHDNRRDRAEELGADVTFDATSDSLHENILSETGGRGADVVIAAAPTASAQRDALQSAGVGGRVNFFSTLPQGEQFTSFPSNRIHYEQIYVTGTSGSSINHFRSTLRFMEAGRLDLGPVITHVYPLEQIQEAVETARRKESLKVVLKPGSGEQESEPTEAEASFPGHPEGVI